LMFNYNHGCYLCSEIIIDIMAEQHREMITLLLVFFFKIIVLLIFGGTVIIAHVVDRLQWIAREEVCIV
jgi:hypothetical protein